MKQSLPFKPWHVIGVAALSVGFGYVAVRIFAAGPAATFLPPDATLAGNATVQNSTAAIGGHMVVFGATPSPTPTPTPTATPAPTPMPSGWPGATNTGYKNAPGYPGSLTSFTGTIQSNTTYSFKLFAGGAYIPAGVTNVTFFGCRFTSNAVADANVTVAGDNITFNYSTFEPSQVSAPPTAYNKGYQYAINQTANSKITVDHSNLWGWGNGIQFYWSSQAKPLTVKNSWFHDARDDGGDIDHTDAILANDGGLSYMVFDHNTIASVGNTNGLALQYDGHSYDHVTVTNNYFSGFGFTMNIGGGGHLSSSVVTDNTWGTDFQQGYGPLYGWGGSGNTWRRNKVHFVTGSHVYIDGEHHAGLITAGDEGKYLLPSNTISTNDYSG
ncbi:MAG TPA: hypothetical protein VHQ86_01095 [Candidatus Saccharimonadia bacterium]|jgi:hypothetical protein|nr:hypothetical protein [Candidatus Saccharimonadia bacterium]